MAPLPPGNGQTYVLSSAAIENIRNDQFLIGYHMIWLGILLTISLMLILFSTNKQRKNCLLALQLLSMGVVLTLEIMFVVYFYKDIGNVINQRGPDDPKVTQLENVGVALDALTAWAPFISDTVLIYRVYEIHSPRLKPQVLQRYLPIIPLLVLQVARMAIIGVTIHSDWIASLTNWDPATGQALFDRFLRYRLAEWALQIIYCSYAFVMIMRQIIRLTRGSNLLRRSASTKMRSRLRFFIEAMFMTFLIPLCLQIGALVSMCFFYKDPNSHTISTVWNRFTQLNYIFSAVFSILATSWSTIREGSNTVLSRSTRKGSSLDHIVGMQELKSKGGSSVDEDRAKVEERECRQGNTLLDKLFPHQVEDDDEEVEELRTTQFNASDGNHLFHRQRSISGHESVKTPM